MSDITERFGALRDCEAELAAARDELEAATESYEVELRMARERERLLREQIVLILREACGDCEAPRIIRWCEDALDAGLDAQADVCSECGQRAEMMEMRDASWEKGQPVPSRRSYGAWWVCRCGFDWPVVGDAAGEQT